MRSPELYGGTLFHWIFADQFFLVDSASKFGERAYNTAISGTDSLVQEHGPEEFIAGITQGAAGLKRGK